MSATETAVALTPAIVHGLRQVSATFKSDSFYREMAIPIDKALKQLDDADAAGPVGAHEMRQRARWELEPMAEQLRIAKNREKALALRAAKRERSGP